MTNIIRRAINKFKVLLYPFFVRFKSKQVRKKNKIRVLFVIAELGAWKTESLYIEMLRHPRFEPVLGITESREAAGSKVVLQKYLELKEYTFVDLDNTDDGIDAIHPDILFYYKPYDASYNAPHRWRNHMYALVCFVDYCFCTSNRVSFLNKVIINKSWLVFVENELVRETRSKVMSNKGRNIRVTGIPMQDILNITPEEVDDPWKDRLGRKRIIYAPHHSIKDTNGEGIEYATILEYGEFMLDLAVKYREKVYFTFKPHPSLYRKLVKVWGQERTDKYYNTWRDMENSQLELGAYSSLFAHSDAMIHDCSSFFVEYQFAHKPVLFLDAGNKIKEDLNEFGKRTFDMQYIAKNKQAIESFIDNVINNKDDMASQRELYYSTCLLPPNGNSASENIINAILGF